MLRRFAPRDTHDGYRPAGDMQQPGGNAAKRELAQRTVAYRADHDQARRPAP
jgi:hypothetical protein